MRQLTRKDLAAALGISPAMVSKLAQRGMPTNDLKAAEAWRRTKLNYTRTENGLADFSKRTPEAVPAAEDAADDWEHDWPGAFTTLCLFAERDLERFMPAVFHLWVNGPDEPDPLGQVPPAVWKALQAYRHGKKTKT
jgi:hypothetical protein